VELLAGVLGALLLSAATSAQADPQQPKDPAARRVLTLDEVVRSAREHQPQLRQAQFGTRAAQARADEARAPLLPQVSATAGYQRTTANFIGRPGSVPQNSTGGTGTGTTATAGSRFDTFNFFSTSVGVTQLIWDFNQTLDRYRSAAAQARATEETERATTLQLVLNARAAFFDARAQKALFAVARDTLTNQQRHLAQSQGFVEAGTRPQIDLAQARSDTATSEVNQINAANAFESSKAALNQAMGIEGPTDYDISDEALPALPGEDQPLDALLQEAQKARPELASVGEQIKADALLVHSIEGAYWPALGASAGFTQGGTTLTSLGWNFQAGLGLSWGIFQGGLTTAQVHEAEANLGSLQAQLDLVRQQIRVELDQARLSVHAGKASLSATQDGLVAAKQRLELAEGRYETGVGNAIELGDAQVAVSNAAAQVVQSDYRLSTARAQLLKALGRQ
jgi:outer membrane protein